MNVQALARAAKQISKVKEQQKYEASLIDFAGYVWSVVEPAIPFVRGWVLEAVCEHLQAVTDGYIKRLLMNVPPGFTKPIRKDQLVQTIRGILPLADVVVGDKILTHRGRFMRVLAVHEQGVLPIVKVETRGGRKVYSAPDHPFLTTRSWVAAGSLRNGDYLAAFEEHLVPDPFLRLSNEEPAECRCLTVEEDSSFVVNGLAVRNSLMTAVFWPAWEWGPRNRPWTRYMCAAYSNHLTERDNMRCRNVVISDRYKKLWGERFRISNEQFTKIKFANDQTGWKLATSVAGIGTGERADRVIIDDPNNPKDMESEVVRDTTNMWFTEIIPDRLNNQAESAIVVIQQRTHEDDVSGTALAREMGYTHLCIPMYYVPARHVNGFTLDDGKPVIKSFTGDLASTVSDDNFFWEDPRQEDGELAWPERFPLKICQELQRDKGPYAWHGQYQQDPEPRGGSIIKREYWQLWDQPKYPPLEFILASLDTAYTEKEENDASALTVWGVFRDQSEVMADPSIAHWLPPGDAQHVAKHIPGNPKIILLHAWNERLEFNELFQRVIETCTPGAMTGNPRFDVDRLIIEAKASGQSVGQELYRLFRGSGKLGIDLIDPRRYGDKVARVHAIQHLFADKMIYAPDKTWADAVINQCAIFPRGSHDDLVDSTSQALRYLRDAGFALKRKEHAVEVEDELRYRRDAPPLYPV